MSLASKFVVSGAKLMQRRSLPDIDAVLNKRLRPLLPHNALTLSSLQFEVSDFLCNFVRPRFKSLISFAILGASLLEVAVDFVFNEVLRVGLDIFIVLCARERDFRSRTAIEGRLD